MGKKQKASRWFLLWAILSTLGCSRGPSIPRNLLESVQQDFPHCNRSGIQGELVDSQGNIYAVNACGSTVTYQCPVGAHSRWRRCVQLEAIGAAPRGRR
ncbi:MAG: hypothetical protein NZM37_09090 [Sandaracinaceae bacterium]|nr:hypothetical protein [Sandaracinaceae bacterium]MDW8247214.1 hypothetical protein [Sandaracinaceae bacterium]